MSNMPTCFGIPFDFTAKPVVAPPQPPRETIQVKAVRPERDALEIRFPRVEGYRVELPEERLTAEFNDDSVLELTPDLVGPSIRKTPASSAKRGSEPRAHSATCGRPGSLRCSPQRLLYTKWRDPGEEPKLHLFGQLKRITQAMARYLSRLQGRHLSGAAHVQELADMACDRITAGITRQFIGERPIKAVLDPYNPTGSTTHVSFNTSKTDRWETEFAALPHQLGHSRQRLGSRVLPRRRVASAGARLRQESQPRSRGAVSLRLGDAQVPARLHRAGGRRPRRRRSAASVVEIKGYRREDAKEKKATMDTYWVPGVNNLGNYGRWAFAEFTEVYQIESDFKAKVESEFNKMIESVARAGRRA